MDRLLVFHEKGLYCPQADVFIDPWRPVKNAIITHAHADHSRWGMGHYLAHHHSLPIMRHRLGADIQAQGVGYGEEVHINGVTISLHPAGHIIGSAQVRLAYKGEIWVVSGDYKTTPDATCTPFEPVPCHTFITESTFGLPVYRWKPEAEVFAEVNDWWRQNRSEGKTTLILGYSLGKAQRIIANLDETIGTIYTHGAVENINEVLRQAGIHVKPTLRLTKETLKKDLPGNIVVAPPSVAGTAWVKKLQPYSVGIASGWMALRGARRRRNVDRGFVLSDHADWQELNSAIAATGAEQVFVTHGYSEIYAQWLQTQGLTAGVVQTEYEGELSEIGEAKVVEEQV